MKSFLFFLLACAVISSTYAQGSILLQPPPYSEVPQAQTVRFTCVGYGTPLPTILWQGPNNTNLDGTSGINIYSEVQVAGSTQFRVSVLELCGVDVSQTGTYSCTASGGNGAPPIGSSTAWFDILVVGDAKVAGSIVVHPPEAQDVDYLDNVELVCMAYGIPLPTITWSIPECNNVNWNCNYTSTINVTDSVINYGDVQFRKSVLQFCSIQALDDNLYTCWANNNISWPGISYSNRSIQLTVNNVPTEPPTTTPTTPPATTPMELSTAPPTSSPASSPASLPSTTESRETALPTVRASTGNDTTYQIVLAIEAVIILALLMLIIFTAVLIIKSSSKKNQQANDSFGYKSWSPDATDRDPGMGAENPLADDPENDDTDYDNPDLSGFDDDMPED